METIKLEIRAAEGGTDSKLILNERVNIYKKTCNVEEFSFLVVQ